MEVKRESRPIPEQGHLENVSILVLMEVKRERAVARNITQNSLGFQSLF